MDIFDYLNANSLKCFSCGKHSKQYPPKEYERKRHFDFRCRNCDIAVNIKTQYSEYDTDMKKTLYSTEYAGHCLMAEIYNHASTEYADLIYRFIETKKTTYTFDTIENKRCIEEIKYIQKNYIYLPIDDKYRYPKAQPEEIELKSILEFPYNMKNILDNYNTFK